MHSGKKKLSLRYCKHVLLFCLLSCFFVLSRTLLKGKLFYYYYYYYYHYYYYNYDCYYYYYHRTN